MESMEFSGKTTEEALSKASEHFNLPMDKLEVEVVSAGSSGLLGFIGAKKAKILVRPLADSAKEAMDEVMREFRGEEEPAAPAPPQPASKPSAEKPAGAKPAPSKRQTIADYSDKPKERPTPQVYDPDEEPSQAIDTRKEEEAPQTTREPETAEVVEASREVLERIVSTLDSDAEVTAKNGYGSGIELEVEGGEVGILIGRRGQTLDALQYLTTRIVSHQEGRPVRISVDAGGYRRRRRDSLEDLALRMADKARQTRRPVSVGPLSSPERRVVHLALKGETGVSTSSRGRGEMKKVLISPRG
jgi:spoIIIJ-associated protein